MGIESLVRDSARDLAPVTAPPSAEGVLRLDGNTNLLGPHPAIRRVLEKEAAADFSLYPSPQHDALRAAIARHHRLEPGEILVGAGADELIDVTIRAFVNPGDPVVIPGPTFELYAFCARVEQARVVEVPLLPDFAIDVDAVLGAAGKIAFVASPNNPTGNAQRSADLERLILNSRGVVVIDEAYAEYGSQDFVKRVREFPNLVVLRTFSKAHGLAGLRVGYAAAGRDVIDRLARVKIPFTVGALSERIALEALADDDHVRRSREMVDREKPLLVDRLRELGLHPFPSDANFLLVKAGRRSDELVRHLAGRGIAVRGLRGGVLGGCFRMTIGRREHHDRAVAAIRDFLISS